MFIHFLHAILATKKPVVEENHISRLLRLRLFQAKGHSSMPQVLIFFILIYKYNMQLIYLVWEQYPWKIPYPFAHKKNKKWESFT